MSLPQTSKQVANCSISHSWLNSKEKDGDFIPFSKWHIFIGITVDFSIISYLCDNCWQFVFLFAATYEISGSDSFTRWLVVREGAKVNRWQGVRVCTLVSIHLSSLSPVCPCTLTSFYLSALSPICPCALMPFHLSTLSPICPCALMPFHLSTLSPICPCALMPFHLSTLSAICPCTLLPFYLSAWCPFTWVPFHLSTLVPSCLFTWAPFHPCTLHRFTHLALYLCT